MLDVGRNLVGSFVLVLSRSTSPRPSGFVASNYVVRGVALSRKPPKLQQAKLFVGKCHRYRALLPSAIV